MNLSTYFKSKSLNDSEDLLKDSKNDGLELEFKKKLEKIQNKIKKRYSIDINSVKSTEFFNVDSIFNNEIVDLTWITIDGITNNEKTVNNKDNRMRLCVFEDNTRRTRNYIWLWPDEEVKKIYRIRDKIREYINSFPVLDYKILNRAFRGSNRISARGIRTDQKDEFIDTILELEKELEKEFNRCYHRGYRIKRDLIRIEFALKYQKFHQEKHGELPTWEDIEQHLKENIEPLLPERIKYGDKVKITIHFDEIILPKRLQEEFRIAAEIAKERQIIEEQTLQKKLDNIKTKEEIFDIKLVMKEKDEKLRIKLEEFQKAMQVGFHNTAVQVFNIATGNFWPEAFEIVNTLLNKVGKGSNKIPTSAIGRLQKLREIFLDIDNLKIGSHKEMNDLVNKFDEILQKAQSGNIDKTNLSEIKVDLQDQLKIIRKNCEMIVTLFEETKKMSGIEKYDTSELRKRRKERQLQGMKQSIKQMIPQEA
ncbi:MAG: hypothetical protein EAX96_06385 [Candidatus Lokiarchaeota archaeon]|nr:hypothetical protein [Candidatus Lokiarchaeota archaeon]